MQNKRLSSFYKKRSSETQNSSYTGSRIPPHAKEAEESVLGGILLDNNVVNLALEIIKAEDFYKTQHQVIFQAMTSLTERGVPIDVVTLSNELKSHGTIEDSGGMDYLAHLATIVPSAANLSYYARLVKDKSLRRKVIHTAGEISTDAFDEETNTQEFLDTVETKILGISDSRISSSFHHVEHIVPEAITLIEKLYDQKEAVTGIPTGYTKLDMMTAGLQKSDLIIIAARPSMGKTAFSLNIGQYVGVTKNQAVAVFSLEMSKEQLVLRMLCSEARVSNSKVRTGQIAERDFPRLVDAAGRIAAAPIYIDDTPALTVTELRAKCRRLHRTQPLSLIIVDYLQLMRSPQYGHISREQEISDISRNLKALAKELSVPVIALSQLNRSVESRENKRPVMSDLRESGAIEQDADIITFIYRDEVYDANSVDKGVAEIIISKHRSGPIGTVRLAFSAEFTRFDNLEERDEYEGIAPSTLPAASGGDLF